MKQVFDWLYVKHRNSILLTTLALYLFVKVINTSVLENVYAWLIFARISILLCAVVFSIYLFVDFINGKFRITPFLVIGVICAIGTLIFAHNTSLCFFLALLYVFKDIKLNRILGVGSLVLFFSLFLVILLALTGVIDNSFHFRRGNIRFNLGFQSAIDMSLWFFCSCATYNFYRKEKITIIELLLEAGINSLIYYFTNTRGGALLVFALIVGSFLLKLFNCEKIKKLVFIKKIKDFFKKRKVHQVLKIFFTYLPIMIFFGFGILVLLYGTKSSLILKINAILSGRLALTYNAFMERKITLFGGIYNWFVNGNYIGVDSAFYHYLFNIGIIGMIFVLIILTLLCYKSFHEKKYFLCFIIFLFLMDSFIDSILYNIHYNLFLLSLFDGSTFQKMIFGKKSEPQIVDNVRLGQQSDSMKNGGGVSC